jgi:hypothetical protein
MGKITIELPLDRAEAVELMKLAAYLRENEPKNIFGKEPPAVRMILHNALGILGFCISAELAEE